MIPKYYGSSIARGHASDIRAAEVPKDYEVKVRKTDRELTAWSTWVTDFLALCWPAAIYASHDRTRRRITGEALAQCSTVRV